jgi:Spy/CpxP family protein refolding chaperone
MNLQGRIELTAIAGLLMIATPALAGGGSGGGPGGGMGGPGMRGQHLERMFEEADLDPATEDKVRAIVTEAREAHRPMREKMRAARIELNDLLEADPPDAAAVVAQADEIGVLLAQAQKMRVATLLQVRSVVTVDEWRDLRRGLDGAFGPGRRGPRAE